MKSNTVVPHSQIAVLQSIFLIFILFRLYSEAHAHRASNNKKSRFKCVARRGNIEATMNKRTEITGNLYFFVALSSKMKKRNNSWHNPKN